MLIRFFVRNENVFLCIKEIFIHLISFLNTVYFIHVSFSINLFKHQLTKQAKKYASYKKSGDFQLISNRLIF